MTTLESAVAIPLVVLLVFAVLLASPSLYGNAERAARGSVAATRSDVPLRPPVAIRTILAVGDSAAILSAWIPGLGDLLVAGGGSREENP